MDRIHTKLPLLLINALLHFQVCSIRCSYPQNGCQPHHHPPGSVQTSGCSFGSQQIWNTILITIAILGTCIMIAKLSAGKWCMYIPISGWHTFVSAQFSSLIVTGWRGGACAIPGGTGVGSDGVAPVRLCLQYVCWYFAVPFYQERQPCITFSRTIAGCLSIAASTFVFPGNTTPRFYSTLTSAPGFLMC